MSTDNNRHVVPNPDGGWDVKAPGNDPNPPRDTKH